MRARWPNACALLDEPLAALDKKLRADVFELYQPAKKLGLTFIIVTDDQQEAMTVADLMGDEPRQPGCRRHAAGNLRAADFTLGRSIHR